MGSFETFIQQNPWLFFIIGVLALWDGIWKTIAMWRAAKNNHLAWFIIIAIINSIGILPIIYLLMNKKKEAEIN